MARQLRVQYPNLQVGSHVMNREIGGSQFSTMTRFADVFWRRRSLMVDGSGDGYLHTVANCLKG